MGQEFELIRRYFTHPGRHTLLGVGDDAALLQPAPGCVLAASTDMLVAGRHFMDDTDPGRLGHKALAVNLSDLAAMGAKPRWALLALALPQVDADWLAAFAAGFHAEAAAHEVDWVGGDTTAGPLNLSVTVLGEVPAAHALRRSGGRVGDQVWVSGTLGDAAVGLALLRGERTLDAAAHAHCVRRLEWPTPRVALGLRLAGLAHAALDVSDGLLADLGHLLEASGVGADLELAALPLSPVLRDHVQHDWVREAVLAGGDDYELCFSAAAADEDRILAAGAASGTPVTRIGVLTAAPGLRVRDPHGATVHTRRRGFDHFPDPAAA
ncbi:MAG: thiamine-phosphate kinase [Pseudomonadota bacterium]|nr:thiamine-phosphate kinase [Pseudomonadota bacterium]